MPNTARSLARRGARAPRRVDRAAQQATTPRPFLKWVGGKGQLLQRLLPNIPEGFGNYHEPFVGGGALFFALTRERKLVRKQANLSDVNEELIDTYRALRDSVDDVIEALAQHRYESEYYYEVRAVDPWGLTRAERAARMIFLNRCGFNGLYRVNKSGQFNVPFGRYTNPKICDDENLRAVSKGLRGVSIEHRPFMSVGQRAEAGDVVYFDPPYVPVSPTANFTSYAQNGFSETDQESLARLVERLCDRGVHVMLSNSDTPWVRERYAQFDVHRVPARRNINSNAHRRGPVGEVVVLA